uniref:UBC core domain-containing protein n=1 Tax=Parascaris univalens TaxID=6257 RepID=A0A915CIN2_PARUN
MRRKVWSCSGVVLRASSASTTVLQPQYITDIKSALYCTLCVRQFAVPHVLFTSVHTIYLFLFQ